MTERLESAALSYRDERADKVYYLDLFAVADGFLVKARFGRRGATLQEQHWEPSDAAAARKLYDSKLKEKVGKGYAPMNAAPAPPAAPQPAPEGGTCEVCQQNMLKVDGCVVSQLQYVMNNGSARKQVGLGTALRDLPLKRMFNKIKHGEGTRGCEDMERCPDCNVKQGQIHHAGCDQEQCPLCFGQLISCPCNENGTFNDVTEYKATPAPQPPQPSPPPGNFPPPLKSMPKHQLCNAIDPDDRLFEKTLNGKLLQGDWWMQPKFDGVRAYVRKAADTLEAFSRTGKPVAISVAVCEAAMALGHDWILDGEMCGDVFFAFDLLWLDGSAYRGLPYHQRLDRLEQLIGTPGVAQPGCRVAQPEPDPRAIRATQTWVTPEMKAKAIALWQQLGGEGVVFKDSTRPYQAGRPNSGGCALKLKFVATATVEVIPKPKEDGKSSVQMAVVEGHRRRDVGTVTIPVNKQAPAVGTLIEVRYLYAFRGGALAQAVYLGPRVDKQQPDAYESLRFKEEPRPSSRKV